MRLPAATSGVRRQAVSPGACRSRCRPLLAVMIPVARQKVAVLTILLAYSLRAAPTARRPRTCSMVHGPASVAAMGSEYKRPSSSLSSALIAAHRCLLTDRCRDLVSTQVWA